MKESICSFFSKCASGDIATLTALITSVSALIALIAACVAIASLLYQRITYKKTQFTVDSDNAMIQFLMSLMLQLVTIEKTYYVTKRFMESSEKKASIDKVYYCGLKIDLSVLNNSLFLSDKMMIVCVNNIKTEITKLNQLIDDIFINNQNSQLSKESTERVFSILSESIKRAYVLWPVTMYELGIREIEKDKKKKNYIKEEKKLISQNSSDTSLYKLTVDTKENRKNRDMSNEDDLRDLRDKANKLLDEYDYEPLISWAYFSKNELFQLYPLLLDFAEEYKDILNSNLIQFNENT